MAIAAFELFRSAGFPAFYFTLQPAKMEIEDYLNLHGYQIVSGSKIIRDIPTSRKHIGEELVKKQKTYADAISHLNYIISKGSEQKTARTSKKKGIITTSTSY